jgi:hypothetical protein
VCSSDLDYFYSVNIHRFRRVSISNGVVDLALSFFYISHAVTLVQESVARIWC